VRCRVAIHALFLATASFAMVHVRAQDTHSVVIKVRVLNSHTREPLKGRQLQLTLTAMNGEWVDNGLIVKGRTEKDGIATFDIAEPVPPRFAIFVWWATPCYRPQDFATKQVAESGVAANWTATGTQKLDAMCETEPTSLPPPPRSPCEVNILVHRRNRLVWAWEDIWR
jgi:hypothetical protein